MAKYFKLNSGAQIPSLGLGTWLSKPHEVANAVEVALKVGYPHIDAAQIYGNEDEVGEGLRKSGVKRENIWLTSKLWNNAHNPAYVEKALDKTLKDLGVSYLDLYLMHWPVSFKPGGEMMPKDSNGVVQLDDTDITKTWEAMEKLLDTGKVKNIGISNFNVEEIEQILKSCKVKPAVHQIETHPYLAQSSFIDFHKKHDIHVSAYSPFGNQNDIYDSGKKYPKIIETDVVKKIAQKHGVDGSVIVCAWNIGRGVSALPKSVNEGRIKTNFKAWGFKLDSDDIKQIDKLDQKLRFNDPSKGFRYEFYKGLDGKK